MHSIGSILQLMIFVIKLSDKHHDKSSPIQIVFNNNSQPSFLISTKMVTNFWHEFTEKSLEIFNAGHRVDAFHLYT